MTRKARELDPIERHQLKIALDTLKMNDVMARVMGGPSKEEARVIVKRLTGRAAKNSPEKRDFPITLIGDPGHAAAQRETVKRLTARRLLCDMERGCKEPVTHIGEKGYVYCANHAPRRQGWERTRRLTRSEIAQLQRGEPLRGFDRKKNAPRRKTGRTLRRKKIASSYTRKRYEFFRKSSVAGLDKPGETAARAKQLADAERWAQKQGVDYSYFYGRDADEESESEWDGRIDAVHPDGSTGSAYGYLGNDYSQSHVRAEAALDLMSQHTGRRSKNPRKVRVVRKVRRVRRVVLRKKSARRTVKRRSNPLLGVLGNPPADSKYLGKVTRIEYTHGHDGQPYYHDFKPPVYAQVMDDGRVVLWHPTNNLWKLFDIK